METPTADKATPALDWATAALDDVASVRADAQAVLDAAGIADLDDSELLTDRQRAILDFERQWWRQPGAKEQAIREAFEMSPTRYYQTLNAVLDLPQAVRYDAALVNRLQRLRASSLRGRRLR